MSNVSNLLISCILCSVFCTPTFAFSTRPIDIWVYYHFDGISFKPGPTVDGSAFIAVRERHQPVVMQTPNSTIEAPVLPKNSGVIAGICYFQTSGGKLGNGAGYIPCPNTPLLISSEGKQLVTVKTDEHGYFVVVLNAGTYSIGNGPFTAEIAVESGVTSLVPLRAGKRMVD